MLVSLNKELVAWCWLRHWMIIVWWEEGSVVKCCMYGGKLFHFKIAKGCAANRKPSEFLGEDADECRVLKNSNCRCIKLWRSFNNRYSCDKVWKKLLSGIMGLVNTINFCDYEASSETFLDCPVHGLYKQFLLETCLWKEDELLYRIEKQLLCSWLCIFNVLRSDFTCIIYFNVAKGKRVIIYCI